MGLQTPLVREGLGSCERNEKIMMFLSQVLKESLSMGPAAHTKAWGRWEQGKQNQTGVAETA